MTNWKDLTKNPFASSNKASAKENAATSDDIVVMEREEAAFTENFLIESSDGRSIPVLVDHGTRSVYPIRAPRS